MGDYPQVRAIAHQAQKRLEQFSGLHMTPAKWLHMTTLVAGSTDDISAEQMQQMAMNAARELAHIRPVTITLGRVLYHPEAIMLGIHPERALDPIRRAAIHATQSALGSDRVTCDSSPWIPHITLAYSTSQQPARPLIQALGRELPTCEVTVRSVSLVVQWGAERLWDWQQVETIPIGISVRDAH
ncbi:2'-5' RNA ligase family protein [Thermomonospora amylolytica]|uniref:2'-5' RNA ligase family protein n=1 Tax=Thermomonospora amylolytica TaxID=1411117 RepID=UPI00389A773A